MKERYLVATMDGQVHNVVANTFTDIIKMFGEDSIWQITKLFFEGGEK